MKTNCGSSPDSITELPTQKKEVKFQMPMVSHTAAPIIATYMQVIPDSQYFTELEQILACLQLNWDNQEYMITALKNSINMGYKLIKP